MTYRLEYHLSVRHLISASIILISLFVCSAYGQINGAPASVTSPGFGGRAINGAPASVTSLGPRGYSSNAPISFSTSVPHVRRDGDGRHHDNGHHRRHSHDEFIVPLYYAFPVPYAVDDSATDGDSETSDNDPSYQGGPTIFDRRGSGDRSYIPPVKDIPAPHSAQLPDDPEANPEPAQAATLLVFKDGRQLEVGNYAIVGVTLFDLTPGHARKVALADLDLEATQKQNEDHGVVFQLPPSLQAN